MLIRGSKYQFRLSELLKLTVLEPLGPQNTQNSCSGAQKNTLTSPHQIFLEVRPPKYHQIGLNAYQGVKYEFKLSKFPKLDLLEPLGP